MQPVTSVNSFLRSLPRPKKRKLWNVVIDGNIVQGVSSPTNSLDDAAAYIANKYPGQTFELVYVGWRITRHQ